MRLTGGVISTLIVVLATTLLGGVLVLVLTVQEVKTVSNNISNSSSIRISNNNNNNNNTHNSSVSSAMGVMSTLTTNQNTQIRMNSTDNYLPRGNTRNDHTRPAAINASLPTFYTTTNTTTTDDDDNHFLPGFRLTRIRPPPIVGQPKQPGPGYQCAGPGYDNYTRAIERFVWKKQRKNPQWGKRPSIIPPASCLPTSDTNKSNNWTRTKTILIIGNSHTRQVAEALQHQYRDDYNPQQNVYVQTEVQPTCRSTTTTRIIAITNPIQCYSRIWKDNLEQVFLRPALDGDTNEYNNNNNKDDPNTHRTTLLQDIDAIVLGLFNVYHPNFEHTGFWTSFRNYAKTHPEYQIDYQGDRWKYGFTVHDLMAVYPGPIVLVSPFGQHSFQHHFAKRFQDAVATIPRAANIPRAAATLQDRTNMRAIDARAMIEELGEGGTCGNPMDMSMVGRCRADNDGHRCTGRRGGVPDLVAWNVVEALHEMFGNHKN